MAEDAEIVVDPTTEETTDVNNEKDTPNLPLDEGNPEEGKEEPKEEIPEDSPELPEGQETQEGEDFDLSEIEAFINDMTDEEIPTEPEFFKEEEGGEEKKDEINPDSEEVITDKDLEELNEAFEDLETKLEEMGTELTAKDAEIEEINSSLTEATTKVTNYSNALDTLGNHPILGPLNEKLLSGEEVDIPKYLKKTKDSELAAIPNMGNISNEKVPPIPKMSLQEKLQQNASRRY